MSKQPQNRILPEGDTGNIFISDDVLHEFNDAQLAEELEKKQRSIGYPIIVRQTEVYDGIWISWFPADIPDNQCRFGGKVTTACFHISACGCKVIPSR